MGRHLDIRVVRPKLQSHLAVLKLSGFINASSVMDFEGALDNLLLEKRLDAVLDFSEVSYINSTGISALLTYAQSWKGKGDEMVLVRVQRPVQVVLEQLGVPTIVPILADESEAVDFLQRNVAGQRTYTDIRTFRERTGKGAAQAGSSPAKPRIADIALTKEGKPYQPSILVIEPSKDLFAEVLALRFNGQPGRYFLTHSCVDALRDFDRISPDVVIVRDSVPQSEEFISKVKIERAKSLTSIIKVYASGSDPRRFKSFKIWENDFFIEPFDVRELFALAEMELRRVLRDRETLTHHTLFRFASTPENVEKAGSLLRDLIHKTSLSEDDASSLLAALKEAIDNAIRHGHHNSPTKSIEVLFQADAAGVTAEVIDEGPGFAYKAYLEQMKDEEAYVQAQKTRQQGKRGGLGILLMHKCTDRLEYVDPGNRLRLFKRYHAAAGGAESSRQPFDKSAVVG